MMPSSSFYFHSTLTRMKTRTKILLNRILPIIIIVLVVCIWTEQVVAQEQEQDIKEEISKSENIGSGDIITTPTNSVPADAILYPWVIQLLGCFSLFILTRFNIPIPYAAIMFMWGALLGLYPSLTTGRHDGNSQYRDYLLDSIVSWININSASLLLIFLPGLIFKDAVEIPINLFQVAIVQIWILAFPMVLVGTAITAAAVKYCLPYQSESPEIYGWAAWVALGAILSSTDPIAVSSVLKTAGASPRLVMHISGESLLNDGSSYVFFTIAAQLWYATLGIGTEESDNTILEWITFFFRMSLGGSAMGAAFGFALLGILWELDRRMEKDFDIVQVVMGLTAAYLCYFVCDQILTMSGVIATVVLGVVVNRFGRGMINDEGLMHSYLALADFLLNTLLFALGGTIWGADSFSHEYSRMVTWRDVGWLLVFYLLCCVIRFIQIGMFYPILSRIGLKSNWKEGIFLAWGGLHGSVGVALGLTLVQHVLQHTDINDIEKRNAATMIQFLGGGATLLTLTINGTSAGFILKQLGLVKPKVSADHIKHLYEGTAKDFIYHQIANLFQEPRFQNVDFAVLKEFVPFVTKEPRRLSCNGNNKVNGGKSIQEFTQRIAGEGQQYINLLNATKRASMHATATIQNEHYKKELLVEMRQIFLELLREAYKVKVELGELDPKKHNGVIRDVLMQSVDLALNDVRYDEMPIDDWKHTEIFFRWDRMTRDHSGFISGSIKRSSSANRELRNRRTSRRVSLGSYETTDDHAKRVSNISFTPSLLSIIGSERSSLSEHHGEKIKLDGKRVRVDVLRAISFKHGHTMAEEKLKLYVNRFDDEKNESMRDRHTLTETTLAQVLTESREQVKFADSMLAKEVDERELNIILSHYCAVILIRRLHKFTEQKADEELIGKQEARLYLRGMKHKIREIRQRTVERLADYADGECAELEFDLENVYEDDCCDNKSRLMHLLKSDTSIDDPQNGDTIGASNTTSSRNLPSFSTPLSALFDPPPGFSVSSMPQISVDRDDDEHEEMKDGGDEAQIEENLGKKEGEEEEEDDDDDDALDDDSRSSDTSAERK